MLQDDQENKVQLCRELGTIVSELLSNSNELLSVFNELFELYKPKSREEANKFYNLRFGLPDSVGLLCDLRKIKIPVTTFMIATDPYLKAFVREFTKANNGNAYYSSLQGLGNLVFEDFKKNRTKNL